MLTIEALLYRRENAWLHEELPELRHLLHDATVIEASNVCRYYYQETPQEEWDLTEDFPNIAPPWPLAWFDYGFPAYSNSNGQQVSLAGMRNWRVGTLMAARDVRAEAPSTLEERAAVQAWMSIGRRLLAERPDEYDRLAPMVRKLGPVEVFRTILTPGEQASWLALVADVKPPDSVRWTVEAWEFLMEPPSSHVHAVQRTIYAVQSSGQLYWSEGGYMAFGPIIDNLSNQQRVHRLKDMGGGTLFLHIPLLAICLAHCKNVELRQVEVPAKLARASERRHGYRGISYGVLEIDPMRTVIRNAAEAERRRTGTAPTRVLHIVRGHFKDYRERGLFGQNHGMYWWAMQTRGSAAIGTHHKAYRSRGGNRP